MVINKKLVKLRFGKAVSSYHKAAQTQAQITEELMDRAHNWLPVKGVRLLEIGCGSGFLTQQLRDKLSVNEWYINDLSGAWKEHIDEILKGISYSFIEGDAETWPFKGKFDVIASCSTLQWFADPEHFIQKAYQSLNPNGLLILSSFGEKNLKEVREVSGKGLNYPNLNNLIASLPQDMEYQIWEQELKIVIQSPLDVLKHLKNTGVTATNSKLWTRKEINEFCEKYKHIHQTNGGVFLTYHPVYLLIRKKG